MPIYCYYTPPRRCWLSPTISLKDNYIYSLVRAQTAKDALAAHLPDLGVEGTVTGVPH